MCHQPISPITTLIRITPSLKQPSMPIWVCFLIFSPEHQDKRGDQNTMNLASSERFLKNVDEEKTLWFHIIGWVLQSIGWQRRQQASLWRDQGAGRREHQGSLPGGDGSWARSGKVNSPSRQSRQSQFWHEQTASAKAWRHKIAWSNWEVCNGPGGKDIGHSGIKSP